MKTNGAMNVNSSNNPANMFANIMCSTLPSNNNNNDSTDSDPLNESSTNTTLNTESNIDDESSLYININNNSSYSGMFKINYLYLLVNIACLVLF
jgi:hypothetical protein